MTQSRKISHPSFFDARQKWGGFSDFLTTAVAAGRAVRITLLPEDVLLEAVGNVSTAIQLEGRWQTPGCQGLVLNEAAVKIALPFLFASTRITLPPEQVMSFGQSYRSIADFVMRNLFIASCRNAPLTLAQETLPDDIRRGAEQLQRQYFYIVKAAFKEPEFESRRANEVMELFLANAYLPVLDFENPVLARSGHCLRNACFREPRNVDPAQTETAILAQRARMVPHF